MTSEIQILANKKNAQRSTGAKTPDGKSVVAQNPTKHGIFSKDIVLKTCVGSESEEEYRNLVHSLVKDLKPEGFLQHTLVEKIATNLWRQRRILRYETGLASMQLKQYQEKYEASSWIWRPRRNMKEIEEEIESKKKELVENDEERVKIINRQIQRLEQEKEELIQHENTLYQLSNLPPNDESEKVMRYSRSIEKSLFDNITMLKKLQADGF